MLNVVAILLANIKQGAIFLPRMNALAYFQNIFYLLLTIQANKV